MILQVELTNLLQECAILALPFQGIHLFPRHGALMGHIKANQADVWRLTQHKICCLRVPNDVCLSAGSDIAVAEERASQNHQLLLQQIVKGMTAMQCGDAAGALVRLDMAALLVWKMRILRGDDKGRVSRAQTHRQILLDCCCICSDVCKACWAADIVEYP